MVLNAAKKPQMVIDYAGGLLGRDAEALGSEMSSLLAGYATDDAGKIRRQRFEL